MKRYHPEFVYGYHGCDESVAKRILESGDPIFPGSMLLAKTHIQLCVRNPEKIIRIFRA